MKPYYRVKGKYADGRNRLVIDYLKEGKKLSRALPKPEDLLDTLRVSKDTEEKLEKNGTPNSMHLGNTKCTEGKDFWQGHPVGHENGDY